MWAAQEQLKDSGVGKFVMLLSKHCRESAENKALCKLLIEKWSRAVFGKSSDYKQRPVPTRKVGPRAGPSLPPPTATSNAPDDADVIDRDTRVLKPGDPGFRYHATIPEALPMDFRVQPQSNAKPLPSRKYDKDSARGKIAGKIMQLKRGPSAKKARAESISIEGRNI